MKFVAFPRVSRKRMKKISLNQLYVGLDMLNIILPRNIFYFLRFIQSISKCLPKILPVSSIVSNSYLLYKEEYRKSCR